MTVANPSPRPTELTTADEAHSELRRMFVRDLVLEADIGVRAHEKGRLQRIRLNLDLGVLDTESTDKLESVVCYDDLIAAVRIVVGEEHVHLIETLAERIAEACFRDRRVMTARVRIEKLDLYADAESVGVEIKRRRPGRTPP
jgi:7,8-dihydroneopterin aldolase/epimerase/oxygenase